MKTEAISLDAARHRLLEGVLLRLARRPDAGEFVLRGGVLLRHWFRPVPRTAEDVDLIASFPFDVEDTARRLLPVLADESIADGVVFEAESASVEEIRLDTGPGVRLFATGSAGGTGADFHLDVTFGPPPRPAPVLTELPTSCGQAIRLNACRPEAVVGHKMQALLHRGPHGWRPKDLEDLRLLLGRVPMAGEDLREAIIAYLADVDHTPADARALFGPSSWWDKKVASARWLEFVRSPRGRAAPRMLADAVAEIAVRLDAVLEGLP